MSLNTDLTTDSISNVNYLYPVPTLATATEPIDANTLKGIADKYKEQFEAHEKIQNQIFKDFQSILDLPDNYETIDSLGTNEFYRDTKTINGKKIDENCCTEGYFSYRFYIKEIVTKLQNIEKYQNEVKKIFQNLNNLTGTDEQISNQAHALIDRLAMLDKFIYENIQDFQKYFISNNDIKQWEQIYINITASSIPSQLLDYNKYTTLDDLRKTKIAYIDSSLGQEPKADISSFNSLTLLDKLKFIRYYYKLILEKNEIFHIFPNDAETGYPCLPNVESQEKTKATQELGALELFYIGYLIDRDGPINAVSSFFEVKTSALRSNIALMSEKISALNEYLSFINRAMDLLNQSQSKASKDKKYRIPDGAWIALTYLCGQDMYNLFEYKDKKYLVIPYNNDYFLVKADKDGMAFLLGEKADEGMSNGCLFVEQTKKLLYFREDMANKTDINKDKTYYKIYTGNNNFSGNEYDKIPISDFKLPTQLDVQTIIPGSVSKYESFTQKDDITTEVVNSWTTAFSNKTQYINTAIDTINTDVTLDRSKIDTFDSLCSTFRNKAHEAYSNTASNIR